MTDTIKIQFNWISNTTDPIQYKPLSPTLAPIGLIVEVEIPNKPKYVIQAIDAGITILTPEGMTYALKQISTAIAKSYSEK
jgi:hypothetical protein